ncbi:MAG: NAD-dependent epimerase/dehydratase family protein [Candidatus Omnitrophica bacterium]|nr:NAD-dependent epimerase/dehydratase family protein [Candidatus Omnitrophota bacterium]
MLEKFDYTFYYRDKTILVTGAAGYIGSSVIRALSALPCNITALVQNKNVFKSPPKGIAGISVIEADIRNREIWRELLEKVDILFHFAAQTSSRIANQNPCIDVEINLLPIVNIIEICQKNNFSPQIIFSGTVTQVGFTNTYPVNETFPDIPITVYDINKLAAEKYLQYYSNQLKREAVVLRLANVYGPGPRSSSADRGILNAMTQKALRGEPLTIYGEGDLIRDYIYIDDVVEAFLTAGAKIDVLKGDYYVIGTGVGYTIKDAINIIKETVAQKTGRSAEILHVLPPQDLSQIEYRNFVADTTRFSTATEWKAKVSLREGINRTICYFLEKERG